MRIKTIIILVIAIILVIVLLQNSGRINFQFLWANFWVSKLVMLLLMTAFGFILGYLVGRPKNIRRLGGDFSDDNINKGTPGTLSDEDKEYIG
jgi:uncharacterized membrane protein YciS (DUF1049 family)